MNGRASFCGRTRSMASALLAVAALVAIGASPALGRGGSVDFGDAPDGAKAGYLTKPGVVGHFPSKLSSGGPRHAGIGTLRLGPTTDGEADSRQVDRDSDDGASLSAPKPCKKATLTTAIRGGPAAAAGRVAYVNAWFDWNRDGDWADPSDGCASEWGVRNMPVPASTLGSVRMLPITIRAGRQVAELWYRVTITLDEVQIDPSGKGRSAPYLYGETEDHLFQQPAGSWLFGKRRRGRGRESEKEPFDVSCVPGVKVIAHGQTASFRFNITGKGKGNIWGAFQVPRSTKSYGITLLPSPNQAGVPRGSKRALGFSYRSKEIDPPTRMEFVEIPVGFQRGFVVRRVVCRVIVVHNGEGEEKGGKKKAKDERGHVKPPKVPPVRCEGGCGGALPPSPPPKGPTLTKYELNADGTARIHVLPADPLNGLTIPLFPPNPVPVDPPKVTAGNRPIECELVPLELTGGPAAERCRFPQPGPPALDSFFDVFYGVSLDGIRPITGTLNAPDGTPVEGFTATPGSPPPPTPSVSGSGTLSPGPNPKAIDFNLEFDVQNTTLTQFSIQVPLSKEVASGGVLGFTCNPVNEPGRHALVCDGPVASEQPIQGGFELTEPRPDQLAAGTTLSGSAGGGTSYGPFGLAQTPVQPSGSGVFTQPGGNVVNFTVNLNSFGALNQFLLDLPNGVQVQSGSAGPFTCVKAGTPDVDNGLQCSGQPIANGQPIAGSITLTAPPPPSIGANSQFFASGPGGGPFGPFSIADGP